jgi:bleomycin hydrolase
MIYALIAALLIQSTVFAQVLTSDEIKRMADELNKHPRKTALMNAISNNNINSLAISNANKGQVNNFINHQVESKGISNQKNSGRCWLFTGLNVMRAQVIQKYKLSEFQFSQNYLFFYDQLEKANLFYNSMIETAFKPMEDREVEWLLKNPIGDGGQWTGVVDLVTKYGLVPSEAMPETYHSENTSVLNNLLSRKLRADGLMLRKMAQGKIAREMVYELKNKKLTEVYQILAFSLGEPPSEFTWEFKDNAGKISEPRVFTPQEFFKEVVQINFDDYVMLMNDPGKEMGKLYEIKYDRHTQEGRNWKYINLPADEIKKYAVASILANEGLYFSCDVGKQLDSEKGFLDLNNYDYNSLFGLNFDMTKQQRIETYESGSTHGMALMGVNLTPDNKPDKWLLENSWGNKGNNGFLIMTDSWFNEYMFRLVVSKKYVDEKTLKILEQEAIVLPPWDPMFLMDQ